MTVRVRDVFRGWEISVRLTGKEWWVSMRDDEGTPVLALCCGDATAALAVAGAWMAVVGDDRELRTSQEEARAEVSALLREAVARMQVGEQLHHDERTDVEAWFRRQWEAGE
jgi:hypothetical protein